MMKKMIALLAPLMLIGCKGAVQSEVYTSDVFSDEDITFPAQLHFSVNSCNNREMRREEEQQILSLFDASAQARVIGCNTVGFRSMLITQFNAVMTNTTSSAPLTIFRVDRRNKIQLTVALNPAFLEKSRNLARKYHMAIDYKDIEFRFNVFNNSDGAVKVWIPSGWVDDVPVEAVTDTRVESRNRVSVRLTKVVSELALQGKQPTIGMFTKI